MQQSLGTYANIRLSSFHDSALHVFLLLGFPQPPFSFLNANLFLNQQQIALPKININSTAQSYVHVPRYLTFV